MTGGEQCRVTAVASTIISSELTPSDGLALATIYVRPIDGTGSFLGAGKNVEVNVSSLAVTLVGGTACRAVTPTCARMIDAGGGFYMIQARSSVAGTEAVFTFTVVGSIDITMPETARTLFDSSQFTLIAANTTVSSSTHVGRNLYITGGTSTFDVSTRGAQFGVLFINGGTVTHPATTTSTVHSLDVRVAALVLQAGKINVTARGYPERYSYGPNGPSTALHAGNGSGGSHGGVGSRGAAVYDDYRNPRLPGAGGTAYDGADGGGVVVVEATGMCTIHSGASIEANGTGGEAACVNPGSGAGGTINLKCGGFGGTAGAAALTASGGAAGSSSSCPANGGGGRIALVSSGDSTSFAGSFAYTSSLATLKSAVRAYGGGATAGAGTIYIKSRDLVYGDMLIDNGTSNTGTTRLVSMAGTAGPSTGSVLPVSFTTAPSLGPAYVNLYAGMRVWSPGLDAATPLDWTDDLIVTVQENDAGTFTVDGPVDDIASGTSLRSIDIFDHLEVGGRAQFSTLGDIFVVSGTLTNPSQRELTMTNGLILTEASGRINRRVRQTLNAGPTPPTA